MTRKMPSVQIVCRKEGTSQKPELSRAMETSVPDTGIVFVTKFVSTG
jgi:hypothetical protein